LKPLKLPNEDKTFNIFNERLVEAERKLPTEKTERKETPSEKERKCAELRHERVMKLAEIMGYNEALGHWRDGITDYELAWELEKALQVPPEVRYQNRKQHWQWHESSWWMRRNTTTPPLTGYDGQGCSYEHGCVPECRYYPETGRIEDSEIIKEHEEENKKYKEKREEQNRRLGFLDTDTDDIKKQKWQEIHKLKNRILDRQLEYLHLHQHGGASCEGLKEIETAAYTEFYNNNNNKHKQI
jgi:hypothetical protein